MNRPPLPGGAVGPVAFTATWVALGSVAPAYRPSREPVSRLAAVGAPMRWPMTAALVALTAGMATFSRAVAADHPEAARAARLHALASIGVAATPLGSRIGGVAHSASAGAWYGSLAAVPALVARDRASLGQRRAAVGAGAVAALTATALVTSTRRAGRRGAWQRTGLSVGHIWIAATAVRLARGSARLS